MKLPTGELNSGQLQDLLVLAGKIETAKTQIAALTADREALESDVASISERRAAGEQGLQTLDATIATKSAGIIVQDTIILIAVVDAKMFSPL